MEALTLAALSALVVKVTSLLKYVSSGQFRQAVTTVIPWGAGVVVLTLGAQADVTAGLGPEVGLPPLGSLDVWSLVLAGVTLGASGSFAFDFKKALDGSDSAQEPPLGGGPT